MAANLNILDYIQNVSTKVYQRGEVIFSQGEASNGTMYFVFEGSVSVYYSKDGVEEQINQIHPGGFFGEVALLSSDPRGATVRVDDGGIAKVGILDQRTFIQIARTTPAFLYQLLRVILDRLKRTETKLYAAQDELKALKGE